MEGCTRYELHVRAVDADGNDLTESGALQKSDIYLFNEQGFVRMIPSDGFSNFYFGEDKGERLTLIAWGNLKEDSLITTEIAPGTPLKDAKLRLRQYDHGTHLPLTDLFYCRKEIGKAETRSVEGADITLVMERMVAGLSIRTRYLSERYPYKGEAYRFIVHCTSTEMDFTGEAAGSGAGYEPAALPIPKGMSMRRLSISSYRRGEAVGNRHYRQGEKLLTITEDNEHRPLYAPVGKHTNIDIDFRYAKVQVAVSVVPWGTVSQDVEM